MHYTSLLIKIEKSNLSGSVNVQMNAEPTKCLKNRDNRQFSSFEGANMRSGIIVKACKSVSR